MKPKTIIILILISILFSVNIAFGVKLKNIAEIQSKVKVPLIGYGLVVGLNGSGDSKGTIFTLQSLNNMMQRMGISLPPNKVKVKNIAAVMVTAEITPLDPVGGRIDVTVSSMGDASSLEGGMLLLTPLSAPNGDVMVWAQGAVSTGGFNAQAAGGNKISKNYTLVGRVPGGGLIEKRFEFLQDNKIIKIQLDTPDYTTASLLSDKIKEKIKYCSAEAISEKTINVIPQKDDITSGEMVSIIAELENIDIEPSSPARVVINERTGTIVAGAGVSIDAVALSHGNLTVKIKSTPIISQPESFSQGKTVKTAETEINAKEETARMIYLNEQTDVSELSRALNAIGATPRDIIAIFQALKSAGALHAELIIL